MENEEDTDFITSADMDIETDDNLVISSVSSNTEFCLVFDDDVMEEGTANQSTASDTSSVKVESSTSGSADLDVEAIKKKANEIANSLKKFRGNKSIDTSMSSQDYEPPEEFKRYHETSLYVAQKLKEDRLLFEESKKRSEAVRSSKRIQKDISKIPPEEHGNFDEIHSLKQKVDKLEFTVAHLQDTLDEKDRIISEKDEALRNLSDSVSNEYAARLNLLEQSQEEIKRIKSEHTKTIERINASKEEFCNQLQVVRQKYLQVENELKLAEFARCRLVNKNAELKEKINKLEKSSREKQSEDEIETENIALPVPDTKDYLSKNVVNPKVECVEMIVNEFHNFLLESAMSNNEFADEESCIEDEDYATKVLEKISDKLESMFYLVKEKFNNVTELEENLKLANDRIKELARINEENKQQETKLKKLLATLKAKVQSESNACKDLTEELSKSKERIQKLQNELSSKSDYDEWKSKYLELEKVNENISYQLSAMREKVEAMEFVEASSAAKESSQSESLKNECNRLHEENNEIALLLEMKNREYDVLMVEFENLRKAQEDGSSSDKTENDFVVLQKKDAECEDKSEEDWKEKYLKLCEDNDKLMSSIRNMSEKAIEWENEKLTMRYYRDENEQLKNEYDKLLDDMNTATATHDENVHLKNECQKLRHNLNTATAAHGENEHEYQKLLDELNAAGRKIAEVTEQKSKAEKEIDILNNKLDALESQLISNEELLSEESLNCAKLREKLLQAEDFNERLKTQVSTLQQKCEQIDASASNDTVVAELKNTIASLETERNKLLEDCEKFKIKYQRLQVYCKANINKGEKSSDGNVDVEKFRNKCKELLVANKQLQASLEQVQQNRLANGDEVEKLIAENESLQSFCNEARQRIESLKEENAQLLSLKATNEDLEVANKRFREALQEAQQNDNSELIEQLETVKNEYEEQKRCYLEAAKQVDRLTRENAELKERTVRLDENRVQQSSFDQVAKEVELLREENQAQKDHYAQSVRQIESLSRENAELRAHLEQQRSNENIHQELNWYKNEFQARENYCNEAAQRIDFLSKENAQLKEMKIAFDQQFSTICEEARKLREEATRMKTENQTLDATNEQLMEFCNKARQQIATLNQNDEAFGIELEGMRAKCEELEAANERLRAGKAAGNDSEEIERMKAENEMLVANNEQLMEFCNNAKHKINELEKVKQSCDELQQTVNTLRESYEMELVDLRNQVFSSEQEQENVESDLPHNVRLALESELAIAREKLEDYREELERKSEALTEAHVQLTNTKAELKKFRSHVEEVQHDAMALVLKCTGEVERLNHTIVELNEDNELLRKRCLSYDEYVTFYEQMSPIISEVRTFSEEAYDIVNKLQDQLSTSAEKVHKAVQCDEIFEYCVRQMYEKDLNEEREKYDSTLSLILRKINDLKECSDKVEKEFLEKEQILIHYKATMEEERNRYEGIIHDLRENSGTESSVTEERIKYERSLAEIQQNQTHDLERYKALVNEERFKYEQIIKEMQENLQHYKSLVDEERTKYERIIFEMQENANKLASRPANADGFDNERQHYENVIFEYQQKLDNSLTLLRESEAKQLKDTGDVEASPRVDFYDENATHQVSELKMFEMFKPTETVQEKLPSVKKYYDYYKGVIKKEIKDILQPEEDDVVGDWEIDQSELKVEDDEVPPHVETSFNLIDALDHLVRRFSITSFSSDYKFDESIEEFPLAFKLAKLFQVVVSYYIDSPKSKENPYALELLKKFREVAQLVDDADNSPQPVPVVIDKISEEKVGELLITAQRLERENKYLLEAVLFFEDLVTEYSNFNCEMRLSELIHRWRENVVFDTAITYYECSAQLDEDKVFPPKCMNEFNQVFNQWKESNVKRLDMLSIRAEIRESDRPVENILVDVYRVMETVKNKLHDLICDLHYIYSSENNQVNPVEFFEQVEDINHWVEQSLKIILSDEGIQRDVKQMTSEDEGEHGHSHDEYDDSPSDGTSDEKHDHSHDHAHDHHHDHSHDHAHDHHHDHSHGHSHSHDKADRDTVVELKSLLEGSNKKIECLVKELMDVKNSREYTEMRQLHSKLDETLYQLHLRDVHCVELTQELTQLLSERDSLQMKLSTILRQNEQLRKANTSSGSSSDIDRSPSNLENKLEELQQVNYMKDPRISEASRLHHTSQMQLFSEDASESYQKSKDNKDSGGLVPSLFKWITGDTEDK